MCGPREFRREEHSQIFEGFDLFERCAIQYKLSSYPEAVNTWNGALENGADLRVNERQKVGHYRARSTEERRRRRRRRRMPNGDF